MVLRPDRLLLGSGEGAVAVVKDVTFAGHNTVVELALVGDGMELWARSHSVPGPGCGRCGPVCGSRARRRVFAREISV
ncbi:TOBE domain-containing protein [Nocardiopsis rhodophaea]|uniref:TOBE domain-containing protein n=1 Tax=Nocardiopsis rhodophaea TaxID=280238 RepID=UPI00338297FF